MTTPSNTDLNPINTTEQDTGDLQRELMLLKRELDSLKREMRQHHGTVQGSGFNQLSGHRDMKVNSLLFGSNQYGIGPGMRLDPTGVQIGFTPAGYAPSGGTSGLSSPSLLTPSGSFPALYALQAYVETPSGQTQMCWLALEPSTYDMIAHLGARGSTTARFAGVGARTNEATTVNAWAYLQAQSGAGELAKLYVQADHTDGGYAAVAQGQGFIFPGNTSDPTSSIGTTNGLVFYRSDTHGYRARVNGGWVYLATDATAILKTFIDAKGDIITGTADNTPAILSVGANGKVLMADSSTSTGLTWGDAGMPTPVMISSFSGYSVGPLGSVLSTTVASTAWPTANLALFIPFVLPAAATVKKLWCVNGGTVSGNIDMGIYDESGTKQVTIGSTAQSGTFQAQEFDVADTALAAGRYYLAIALDNTTGTIYATTGLFGGTLSGVKTVGIAQATSSFALPASVTYAVPANNYVPYCGLSLRTQVA